MWEKPSHIILTSGSGEAAFSLNAFDRALAAAGVANYNHSRLSSIITPGAIVEFQSGRCLIPEGNILPTVYSTCSGVTGDTISCCVSAAINLDPSLCGVLFEVSGIMSRQEAEQTARQMAVQGMEDRGYFIKNILVVSASLTIRQKTGSVVSLAYFVP